MHRLSILILASIVGFFLALSPAVAADTPNEWLIMVSGSTHEPVYKINGIDGLNVLHDQSVKKSKTNHTYTAFTEDGVAALSLRVIEHTKKVKVKGAKAVRTTYHFEKVTYNGEKKTIKPKTRLIIHEYADGRVTQEYSVKKGIHRMVEFVPEKNVSYVYDWVLGKLTKVYEMPGYASLTMGTQYGNMYGSIPYASDE